MKIPKKIQALGALLMMAALLLAPSAKPAYAQFGEGSEQYEQMIEIVKKGLLPSEPPVTPGIGENPVYVPMMTRDQNGAVVTEPSAAGDIAAAAVCPNLLGFPTAQPTPDGCRGLGNDGAFIDVSRGLATLGDPTAKDKIVSISLAVPASLSEFSLSVFDGDMGGSWDRWDALTGFDQVDIRLFRDPFLVGNVLPANLIEVWDASAAIDNSWCDLEDGAPGPGDGNGACLAAPAGYAGHSTNKITQDPGACVGDVCFYHFVIDWETTNFTDESNFVKMAAEGQPFLLGGSTIGFQGTDSNYNACPFNPADPQAQVDCWNANRVPYTGEFNFNFYVPPDFGSGGGAPEYIDLYDGDFDRRDDTDDANSPSGPCQGLPAPGNGFTAFFNDQAAVNCVIETWNSFAQAWETSQYPPFKQSPSTLAEGANLGRPADDLVPGAPATAFLTKAPFIAWELTAPNAAWNYINDNPSGQNDWEITRIGTLGKNVPTPDVEVADIMPGLYNWRIYGADAWNNLFVHTEYTMVAGTPSCDLKVSKSCSVDVQPGDLLCESAIAATTLRYIGPDIADATVTFAGSSSGSATYSNVALVSGVTILTDPSENDWTIDGSPKLGSKTTIVITDNTAGTSFTEIIHTSCSAVYEAGFPAPLDSNTPVPPDSDKGDPSPNWFVESFLDEDGNKVTVPGSGGVCEVPTGGGDVTYDFEVINLSGIDTYTDVTLLDNRLGQVLGPITLGPGISETVSVNAFIEFPTINVVTAGGYNTGVVLCTDQAAATVVVSQTPPCVVGEKSAPKVSDDKIEWEIENLGTKLVTIESIDIEFPAGKGNVDKIKLDKKEIYKDATGKPSPASFGAADWNGSADDRSIDADKDKKLTFEFTDKETDGPYKITVVFEQGCQISWDSTSLDGTFACEKPLDALTMIWDGSQTVDIKAWKDNPGDILLASISGIAVGDEATVTGYAPKDGNDVIWEIFEAGTSTKIGESVFHMSCSDSNMNSADDCGKNEGDGKNNDSNYINDWLLEGMVDAVGVLDCTP